MARISLENLKKLEKSRNTVHKKVETTYTIFEIDGEKYVQLDYLLLSLWQYYREITIQFLVLVHGSALLSQAAPK